LAAGGREQARLSIWARLASVPRPPQALEGRPQQDREADLHGHGEHVQEAERIAVQAIGALDRQAPQQPVDEQQGDTAGGQ
jgi:hypothetical protein